MCVKFYKLSFGATLFVLSLFYEKLESKIWQKFIWKLGVFGDFGHYKLRPLEAGFPFILDKNKCHIWIPHSPNHGNQVERLIYLKLCNFEQVYWGSPLCPRASTVVGALCPLLQVNRGGVECSVIFLWLFFFFHFVPTYSRFFLNFPFLFEVSSTDAWGTCPVCPL